MALYTEKERKATLKRLRIDPDAERVTNAQAIKVLNWRAKEEFGVEMQYSANSVRKHADKLDAQPAHKKDGTINPRQNTYDTKKLFEIEIMPTRTNAGGRKAS